MSRRGAHGGLRAGAPAAALLAAIALLALGGRAAMGETLVADLSKRLVAITTGFAGTDVLLFGALEGPGDVVVIVRGPDRPLTMYRKSRVLGIWANTAQITFDRAPSFYAVASSKPLQEIALNTVLAREEIGVEHLRLELPSAKASPNVAREWRLGVIRNFQRQGLYATDVKPVTFLGNRLFRAELQLPANVPTGAYQVVTYLLRDGHVVSAQRMALPVTKIGTEAVVYDFAHQYSAMYGLIAIAIALVAGWLAHVAFRKR